MMELRDGNCYPEVLTGVNVSLATVDGAIAALAFYQLARIHVRNPHLGWTRQKVFHLMIGSSNLGYFIYFLLTLVAACKGWSCWSFSCGFVFMAYPKILFVGAFLLLLSFWPSKYASLWGWFYRVDICHQANDEDEDDEECTTRDPLLDQSSSKPQLRPDRQRKCCSLPLIHVGSRQRVVVLVTALIFLFMIIAAVLIWIGMGRNPIDSQVVARVYVSMLAVAVLCLGGALACYGYLLFLKMRKVRSERAASEMRKVVGLAIVSVLCFTSSALVALTTDIPMFYHWHDIRVDSIYTSLMLILYYFIGVSVPSIFVLWVMRELPPPAVTSSPEESRTITFIHGSSVSIHSQHWTTTARSQNQVSRASPI